MDKATKTALEEARVLEKEIHPFCLLSDGEATTSDPQTLASEIKAGVDNSNFFFIAQGIFDYQGTRTKSELLTRFHGRWGTIIKPSVFIPIIHAIGYRNIFDYKVLEKAFATIASEKLSGSFSINISPSTFEQNERFIAEVDRCAKSYGVSPDQIIFEILETEAIRDYKKFNRVLRKLRTRGYRIAVDDFHPIGNNNLLSLAKLGRQEIDIVKFDGGFVEGLYESRNSIDWPNIRSEFRYMKDAIYADRPNIEVIVEKVESEDVFRFFLDIDAKHHILSFQGYYFDRGTPIV